MRAQDYSLVVAQGSPGYVAPLDPACSAEHRFMPVHLVSGGGWGIVDRRTGRLRGGPVAASRDRYASWVEATAAVTGLNVAEGR